MNQANINKHYIMLNMEMMISILSIWSEQIGFTDCFYCELCYRFHSSIKNRPAILYLLGTILKMNAANDKAVYHEALRTLTSPYTPKKYEKKPDTKEKDGITQKERKPLPLIKYHHHDQLFSDWHGSNLPLLENMFHSLFEAKSTLFDIALDKFLESLFL